MPAAVVVRSSLPSTAFTPAFDFHPPIPLQAQGLTPLGEGMRLAMKLVRDRKDELRAQGLPMYCPRILLVSDGAPNDDGWEQGADAAVAEEKRKGVSVYPVGVKDADMTALSRFSIRRPLPLSGYDFAALFQWHEVEALLDESDYNWRYDEMREEIVADEQLSEAVGLPERPENPEGRCPVVLLLDASASMQGEKIRQLNTGLATFNHHLHRDELACLRIEIALVAVGGTAARVLDVRGGGGAIRANGDAFAPAKDFSPPTLQVRGLTPLGEGMRLALKLIRNRKDELRAWGLPLYRPWILLVSDGAPTDDGWEEAADAAVAEERRKGVSVYPVGVKDADMTRLARFSNREPLMLMKLMGEYAFPELFRWLSDSLGTVARSQPGDSIQLEDPRKAWAEDWTAGKA